jgi:L-threonylcarbamoyladenylate synthase
VVAAALNQSAVEHLRQIRGKAEDKPLIVLISQLADLKLFEINLTPPQMDQLNKFWPGPVSVILKAPGDKFTYLHRGTETLALRLPRHPALQELLAQTGPLVAPSANLPNQPPATTIAEARDYFGNQVDLYVDGGRLIGKPSTLIELGDHGELKVLRGILKP